MKDYIEILMKVSLGSSGRTLLNDEAIENFGYNNINPVLVH